MDRSFSYIAVTSKPLYYHKKAVPLGCDNPKLTHLTAALLDRLTHKAHIIPCNWASYRLRESLKKKTPATGKEKK